MLRLLRTPNLLIVLLTQYLLQYGLLLPALQPYSIPASLDHLHFFLLSITTVLIAAGGYIINDLIDYPIDKINKSEQLSIGQAISIPAAWRLYWIISLTGSIIAAYLALHVQSPVLFLIYPAAVSMLFWYSKYFKRIILIGNLVIAIFCAFVAGLVWFAERDSFSLLVELAPAEAQDLASLFIAYLLFGFLSTLYREIIKDIEDKVGDALLHCKTLPIVWGTKNAKWIAGLTGFLLVSLILYWSLFLGELNPLTWSFMLTAVIIPLLFNLWLLFQANQKSDFARLSRWAKYIMLSGLLFLFLICIT